MHAIARRPLWVRVGAGILSTFLFLTNTVYPWISLLPAPPIVVAQESVATATDSAEATPAASVATPAPLPLDPLDNLDSLLLPSSPSAEIPLPEAPPESSPSATPTPTPEVPPEDQTSTPRSEAETPNEAPPLQDEVGQLSTLHIESESSREMPPDAEQSGRLPPALSPFAIRLALPFAGDYPLTYGFGAHSPNQYVSLMQSLFAVTAHDGLDYALPERTPVLATDAGEVIFAGEGLYGNTVILRHAWGRSYYGHLSQISVTVGDQLSPAAPLGLSGNTGVSTAPHLHFGIRPNHYDPENGYHGLIDPLPYLTGAVLGTTTTPHNLIHLPYKTLASTDLSLSIPILASDSAKLTYHLKDPHGNLKRVYPTLYNYGTGETAILPRPSPLIPGEYTLIVADLLGQTDSVSFAWGVLALNPNQSQYLSGQTATLSYAVLDELGEMVCDADLVLNLRSPSGTYIQLTTDNGGIIRNYSVCTSKALTLTPDYVSTFTPSELGTYELQLTAYTNKHTFTATDSFEVAASLPYTLERLAATRIYPVQRYPVFLKITAYTTLSSELTELLPSSFTHQALSPDSTSPWLTPTDLESFDPTPPTLAPTPSPNSLHWSLSLNAGETKILGYSYDAPDESPSAYSLGPATFAGLSETRAWQIAVDAVDPVVGGFGPTSNTLTNAGDANLDLRQPGPMSGDLMVAVIAIRPSTSTVNTPSGWTSHGSWSGTDGGAEGVDTGSVSLYWFSKVADGTEGTSTQTFTETGTTSVWMGYILKLRSSTGTYDISSAGYSINGDTGTWGSTLDSDVGLRTGDVVYMAGAQNGDLSAASAYALSATNLNSMATFREYGEYVTTTGNDLEIDLAETHIWDGNNTTTPTTTFTQGTAVSGAVSVLRIRQGSGTNRTDTWTRSMGSRSAGTTSVTPAYPEHDPGDLLVLFVASRGTTDPTPTTPTGWTSLGSYNGGAGSFGLDAGPARITAFYRQTFTRNTANQTVTITGADASVGQMYAIHRDNVATWTTAVDGGSDTTGGTGWSVTGSGLSLDSADGGDVLLILNSINTDGWFYSSLGITASGSTITTPTEDGEYRSGTGNDIGVHTASTEVTSGSGSAAPTYTMTSSGSATNSPAGSTMLIKIIGVSESINTKAVGLFTPASAWASAGDATLALRYPDPEAGDLMLAVTAIRPSTSTVDTPSGWTLVDSRTGTDSGAENVDTGSVGLYIFSKTADGTEGTGNLNFTETGTTSVFIGKIMKLRSGTGTYDVSASGYSLNGDTATWGSTLGADPGLTGGDFVLLVGAQNGDLSNTSAWDLTADGVTVKSSVNEIGEYASTTGNDVEVDVASTLIWEGTSTAAPVLTITQSAAASGAVSAIRIREGSGVQRTDTWIRGSGPAAVGTTSVTVAYPEHERGDLLLLFVGSRGSADPTVAAPVGWTSLGTYNGGTGTFTADSGNSRVTAYYRETASRYWGTITLAVSGGDTVVAQMQAVHVKDIATWSLDSDGGTDSSAGVSYSVAGSSLDLTSTEGGDVVLAVSSINTDAREYGSHDLQASGMTFSDVNQNSEYRSATGSDMTLETVAGRVTAGTTSSPAVTFSSTANGSGTSDPTGSTLLIKVLGTPSTMTVSGTASVANNGATVKIAVNSSLQAQTATIDTGTWAIYGVTRPSVGAVLTVWVDNVADTNESTAVTLYNSAPVSSLVLTTNTLTLGSNQDQSLSITNLNSYDCTEDEDIMHQSASSHLKVEGDSCAGSSTNSYTAPVLAIASGDTLAVGATETVTTYDLTLAGTLTSTSTATYNVEHDWSNTGTFTAGNSTVNLTGGDSTTQTLSGTTTFYNLSATTTSNSAGRTLAFTGGTTTTVSNTWTATGATSKVLTLGSTDTTNWTIAPTSANVDYTTVARSTSTLAICATHSTDGGNNNANWTFSAGSSCSSNTAPDNPTSLLQTTTADVTLTTGAWHNTTSVKFSVTATDTDNPDTLALCVEADQLGTSFSNTEDSCGTGVAYSGTGVTLTHTLTLTDALEYHWQVRVKDTAGDYSSWVAYGGNAESARDFGLDTTAPTGGTVYDGSSVGVDTTFATSSLSSLSANWASFNADVSGLARYDYSIGTTAGATDIKVWTDNGTSTSVSATGLTLQTSQLYFVNVRAVDNAGNTQSAVSSNGQLVSPSLSFAITPATTTFTNLGVGNSYTDTKTTTLTTSTNAYNGYVIRAFATDYLKSLGGVHQIADFNGGTYASPGTWSGSETGFGYTSSDSNVQGLDKFGSGTLYAPFSTVGPGDIVADHTSSVTGSSISNETFDITYKVKLPADTPATTYTSTIVYTATAQY